MYKDSPCGTSGTGVPFFSPLFFCIPLTADMPQRVRCYQYYTTILIEDTDTVDIFSRYEGGGGDDVIPGR